jgi:predicted negative regulator of RcsB-dependent stress response
MSSSHLTRKDLKNDPLTHEVEVGAHYVADHRKLFTNVAIAIGVLLVGYGAYSYYSNSQAEKREVALFEARRVMIATVGATPAAGKGLHFNTVEERDKAVADAYTKLAADYPGTAEGAIAKLYVAAAKADKGEIDGAVTDYRAVVSSAPAPFVSTAKLALGQILYSQGKVDEGRKLIQEVIDSPTEFVSSEHASLALARLLLKDKPEEARKLLDALAKSRSAVSTVAVELSAQLPRVN